MDYIAHQASLSIGFPRQEYWNEFPFPSPGNFPNPGIEPKALPVSPVLQAHFTTGPLGKLIIIEYILLTIYIYLDKFLSQSNEYEMNETN